ncbi:HPF/RaiA family ribosome-associated protein [uncultured Limnobacter sp.]|uniref:HPF/RaiA family ribosome-associated protein n=1 Tax=uncultured Limnobacter sp. TaxID=199681 RepID=UPI0030F9219E
MNTEIVARHPEIDDTLRRYVLRRVRSAINQLSTQIKNITVKLDRRTAQQADQRNCVIEIRIDGQAPVIVDSAGSHWLSAIDQAVESAARAVRRQLKHTLHQVTPHLQLLKGQHAS